MDYELHGLVGIRLVNAAPADVAAVNRQLGSIQGTLNREPDIIIRFVERPLTTAPQHYLGGRGVAFTDDAFLLGGEEHERALVCMALDKIGGRCEIVCETGGPAVPLLVPILNLTVLGKGLVPLHASAFLYNGTGVVATGWAQGGKTGTLLAFMAQAALYIGDDWVYVSRDGRRIYGIPQPVQIRDAYLQDLPQYRARLGPFRKARQWGQRQTRAAIHRWSRKLPALSLPGKVLRRLDGMLDEQLTQSLLPHHLFGSKACRTAGPLHKLFLLLSHDSEQITVEPADPQEVARRLAFALQHERLGLFASYLKFRFAFPDADNNLLDQAADLERRLLERALADKEVYIVGHPYPVRPSALFEALQPFLKGSDNPPLSPLPPAAEEEEEERGRGRDQAEKVATLQAPCPG